MLYVNFEGYHVIHVISCQVRCHTSFKKRRNNIPYQNVELNGLVFQMCQSLSQGLRDREGLSAGVKVKCFFERKV